MLDFYKSVFELPPEDRPDDDTIENDAQLDSYLADLSRHNAEQRMRLKNKS